jgi:hypothetical protein
MTLHIMDGNQQFRQKFEANGTIRDIIFEMNMMPMTDVVIWTFDGHGAKERRRKLYPEYKVGRPRASDEFYRTMDLFKQVLRHTRCMTLEIAGWEADDIIGTLVKMYVSPTMKIKIHSNDGDFLQLCDGDLVSMPGRNEYPETDWKEVRLYKTLVGDKSDKIKGIPQFGDKAWEHCDRERWLQYFTGGYEPHWDSEAGSFNLVARNIPWVKENESVLRAMWEITGLYVVPEEDIQKNLSVGVKDDRQINEILKDFLL